VFLLDYLWMMLILFARHRRVCTLQTSIYKAQHNYDRTAASLVSTQTYSTQVSKILEKIRDEYESKIKNPLNGFVRGANAVYGDFLTYRNINAAAKSKENIWRGKIPRRQVEQQRKFKQDIFKVFPTIFWWQAIPFVGFSVAFFALIYPRYLLSSQFYSEDQRRKFAHMDYVRKRDYFDALVSSGVGINFDVMNRLLAHETDVDDAEYDMAGFYQLRVF